MAKNRNNKTTGEELSSKTSNGGNADRTSTGRAGNGRRSRRKPNSKGNDKGYGSDVHTSGAINDPNFYVLDENIINGVCNYPIVPFIGQKEYYETDSKTSVRSFPNYSYTPDLMVIMMNPALYHNGLHSNGYSSYKFDYADPINTAAKALYYRLSMKSSNTQKYGPSDPYMAVLGVASLLELAGHISRAFGLATITNNRNRNFPKHILMQIYGWSEGQIADFYDNRQNYLSLFNVQLVRTNTIPMPADIKIFKKFAQMYTGLYLDSATSPMAQTYAFAPDHIWRLNEDVSDQGSVLETVQVNSLDIEELIDLYTSMLDNLLASSTLNYVYADILRLCDREGLQRLQVATLSNDYSILPAVEPEIKTWINNAYVFGRPMIGDDTHTPFVVKDAISNQFITVTPDNDVLSTPDGFIQYSPVLGVNSGIVSETRPTHHILNFEAENPSMAEKINAMGLNGFGIYTALKYKPDTKEEDYASGIIDCQTADHYITRIVVCNANPDIAPDLMLSLINRSDFLTDATMGENVKLRTLSMVSQFDWAPFFYYSTGTTDNERIFYTFGDTMFHTPISDQFTKTFYNMSYQALLKI